LAICLAFKEQSLASTIRGRNCNSRGQEKKLKSEELKEIELGHSDMFIQMDLWANSWAKCEVYQELLGLWDDSAGNQLVFIYDGRSLSIHVDH
jgi:hypothetical protein